MIERRNFTRVDFEAEAMVECGDLVVRGRSENVSLKGLFLRTSEQLELGKDIKIKLFLHGLEDQFVDLSGKVMRQQNGGFGIQFAPMDFTAFMDLKRIVSLLVGDEGQVISEFTKSLDFGDQKTEG